MKAGIDPAGPNRERGGVPSLMALVLGLAALVCAAIGVIGVLNMPAERRVQFVPDDGFYYLVLSQNHANQGRWTFDSGTSVTTGFHPLHAYALDWLYRLLGPSKEQFVKAAVTLTTLAALPAAIIGILWTMRRGCIAAALLLAAMIASRNVALNLVSITEWSWVVSFTTAYVAMFACLSAGRKRTLVTVGLFICGMLLTLARTDAAILPGLLAAGGVACSLFGRDRRFLLGGVVGVLGAATGLGLATLHSYLVTGQWVQSSVQIKLLWFKYSGISLKPFVWHVLSLFGPQAAKVTWIFVGAIALVTIALAARAAVAFRTRWATAHRNAAEAADASWTCDALLWGASAITIVAYAAIYAMNPWGVQCWYTGNVIVPLFLVIALPLMRLRRSSASALSCTLLLLGLAYWEGRQALRFSESPEWRHASQLYQAGIYLNAVPLDARIGSWNAGIIGYYADRNVINLDGLVNNDIYSFAKDNRLPEYIDQQSIGYIIDYESMLSPPNSTRGGYERRDFLDRLVPVRTFGPLDAESSVRETLYRITPLAPQ